MISLFGILLVEEPNLVESSEGKNQGGDEAVHLHTPLHIPSGMDDFNLQTPSHNQALVSGLDVQTPPQNQRGLPGLDLQTPVQNPDLLCSLQSSVESKCSMRSNAS